MFLTIAAMPESAIPSFISRLVVRGRYLFLDLDPPAGTDLAVTCAGWEHCAPDYEIERATFRYHALEYIVSGAWALTTSQGRWELGPGAVFAYGPGVAFSLQAVSRTGLTKYFVDFTGRSAGRLLARAGLHDARPGRAVHGRWLHDLLDQLVETARLRPVARPGISRMLLALLLERAREDLRIETHCSTAERRYDDCRRYLTDNYLQVRSLADAARACGLSPVHLSRLFRRFAAESPHGFLSRLKMNHAAELIARGGFPVKAAAAAVGFDDPYHFSRVFKRVHGCAPSRFWREEGGATR